MFHPHSLYPRLLLMLCRNHGSHFEKAKTAFEEGGGRDELVDAPEVLRARREQDSMEKENVDEQMEKV
jgi:MFS transporter, SHS family, lactate transporter